MYPFIHLYLFMENILKENLNRNVKNRKAGWFDRWCNDSNIVLLYTM